MKGANECERKMREGEKKKVRKKDCLFWKLTHIALKKGLEILEGTFLEEKIFGYIFDKTAIKWGSGDLTVRGKYFNLISLPNLFFFLISIPLLWLKSRFECDAAACRALSLCQSSFSAFRRYVLVCFSVI